MSEFIDPLRDPRFPDRPQHSDFWRLVEVVNKLDGASSEGGKSLTETLSGLIDPESAQYMATQRAGLFMSLTVVPQNAVVQTALAAMFINGVAAGIEFERGRQT